MCAHFKESGEIWPKVGSFLLSLPSCWHEYVPEESISPQGEGTYLLV